jgi:hypothetical protein
MVTFLLLSSVRQSELIEEIISRFGGRATGLKVWDELLRRVDVSIPGAVLRREAEIISGRMKQLEENALRSDKRRHRIEARARSSAFEDSSQTFNPTPPIPRPSRRRISRVQIVEDLPPVTPEMRLNDEEAADLLLSFRNFKDPRRTSIVSSETREKSRNTFSSNPKSKSTTNLLNRKGAAPKRERPSSDDDYVDEPKRKRRAPRTSAPTNRNQLEFRQLPSLRRPGVQLPRSTPWTESPAAEIGTVFPTICPPEEEIKSANVSASNFLQILQRVILCEFISSESRFLRVVTPQDDT